VLPASCTAWRRREPRAILTPIAPGELLDKLTMLTIKSERIVDEVPPDWK